jgi:hypothetical protein
MRYLGRDGSFGAFSLRSTCFKHAGTLATIRRHYFRTCTGRKSYPVKGCYGVRWFASREISPFRVRSSDAIGPVEDFRFNSLTLGSGDAIDEQNSVKMIVLVLNRTREESTGLKLEHLAIERLGSHAHTSGPGHVAPHSREAQAALNTRFRLSERLYFGIDKHQRHMLDDLHNLVAYPQRTWSILNAFDIDDAKLNWQTHLLSGEANPFRRIHRLEHLVRQSTDPSVYVVDSPSFGTQRRMAIWDDAQGHAL